MKRYRILVVVALVPSLLSAQTMAWLEPLDIHVPINSFFNNTSLAVDADGNAAIMGLTGTVTWWGSQQLGDLAWRTFDPLGQPLANVDLPAVAGAMDMVAHGGSFFVVGQYKDSLHFPGHQLLSTVGQVDPIGSYICRIELNGTVTWVKDAQDLGLQSAQSIAAGPGGVLYIGAWDFQNAVVVKADLIGTVVDTWTLQGVGVVSDVAVNASGSVAIAGSCVSNTADLNGTSITHAFSYTVFMARFDASGTLQDHVIVEDVTCTFPMVALDDLGNAFLSADASIPAAVGPFIIPDPAWVYGEFLVMMDTTGTVSWLNVPLPGVPLGDAARAGGRDLVLHPDGGVWQGGFARGANDWGNGMTTSASIPGQQLYFRRVDVSGNTQSILTSDASTYGQSVQSLATDGNDALYMLGFAYDTLQLGGITFPEQGYHAFLTRWDATSTGVQEKVLSKELALFPNPANDAVTVDLSGLNGNVRIEVIDALGRTVLQYRGSAGGPLHLDLSALPSARYVIRALTMDSVVIGNLIKR